MEEKSINEKELKEAIEQARGILAPEDMQAVLQVLDIIKEMGTIYGDTGPGPQETLAILKKLIPALAEEAREMTPEELKESERQEELIRRALSRPDVKQEIPAIVGKLSDKYIALNDKITWALTKEKEILNGDPIELKVMEKPLVKTAVLLTYEGDNIEYRSRQALDGYDEAILGAVINLYCTGVDKFTPAMVYRRVANLTESEYVSRKQQDDICMRIDKMRFARIIIDCTEELKKRNVIPNDLKVKAGGLKDNYLLALDKIIAWAGGRQVRSYKFLEEPINLAYAKMTKQIITVPDIVLKIKENGQRVSNSKDRIVINLHLLRRVARILNPKNYKSLSNHICYQDIYDVVDAQSRVKKKRIRDYVITVLNYWVEIGYIRGYSELEDEYRGVAIKRGQGKLFISEQEESQTGAGHERENAPVSKKTKE